MFSKLSLCTAIFLTLAIQVHGHAAVAPVLGLSGNPVRADVKRPNNINPCGAGVNAASLIDSSTAAQADADGSFSGTVFNFNRGVDGSRQVTAAVDPTGTGTSFTSMSVTTNGDFFSKELGSQPIVANLPAGMVCTGGTTKNKCLVQFKNAAGFGNCMVVSQDNGSSNSTAVDSTGVASPENNTESDAANSTNAVDSQSNVPPNSTSDNGGVSANASISNSTDTTTGVNTTSVSSSADSKANGANETKSVAQANTVTGSTFSATSVAPGTVAGNIVGGLRGALTNGLTSLKGKLQGSAQQPGTRAARSLLSQMSNL